MQHTPGPWTVEPGPKDDPDGDDADFIIVAPHLLGGAGEVVAVVIGPISVGTPEGNARVLGASTDLVDALLAVHDPIGYCHRTGQDYGVEGWLARKIVDALTKALGEGLGR